MNPLTLFIYLLLGLSGMFLIALTGSGGTICVFNTQTGMSLNAAPSVQFAVGVLFVAGATALIRGDIR